MRTGDLIHAAWRARRTKAAVQLEFHHGNRDRLVSVFPQLLVSELGAKFIFAHAELKRCGATEDFGLVTHEDAVVSDGFARLLVLEFAQFDALDFTG
jgi:hypothetical protein